MKYILTVALLTACGLAQGAQPHAASNVAEADSISDPNYSELEDIVVVADMPMVKSDGAKTTYDVEQDPTATSLTVLDLLKKVPTLSVDAQDNILLNGQSDFKIYVNGHEDPSLSQNASRILKMMPATSVSKVEVIREPGSKYDAEGTAGIINIVMATAEKTSSDGQTGNISFALSNRDVSPSVYFRMKRKNVTASVSAVYAHSVMPQKNESTTTTDYLESNNLTRLVEKTKQRLSMNYWNAAADLSWEPNPRNLFTFNVSGNGVYANDIKIDASADNYLANISQVYRNARKINGSLSIESVNAQASYRRDFNEAGHNLILSYLFLYGLNSFKLNQMYEQMESPNPLDAMFIYQLNNNFNREHTAQIDYALPFNENHKLEAGGKGLFRRNSGFGHSKAGNDEADAKLQNETAVAQYQDILAAYFSYNGQASNWSWLAGIRYEHTDMRLHQHAGTGLDFTKKLNDIIPNAALTYSFSPMQNIRLSYQMRLSRPTIEQVNPFETYLETNSVRKGNPDLSSQRLNRVTLTYTQFGRVLGGNIGVEYSNTNNLIESYQYLKDGIIYDTYANTGRRQEVMLTCFLNWSIINQMTLRVSGRAGYVDFDNKTMVDRHGFTGNYNVNWEYTLPCRLQLSAYGGQGFRSQTAQGYYGGWYYYGVGVSRSFLKDDAMTLSLNAGNFLQKMLNTDYMSKSDNFITHGSYKNDAWRVGINISWNFGKLSTQVKKTGANVNADDAPDAKKQNGGGGL